MIISIACRSTDMAQLDPVLQKVEEDRKFVQENEWMIRPCTIYDAEYSECKAIKSRFYQYYRDGVMTDCNPWLTKYNDCKQYEKKSDFAAGARLIQNEMKLLDERIKRHEDNDVWKRRQNRPPPNWNCPLPPHLEKNTKDSYYIGREEQMRQKLDIASSRCTIC